MKRKKTPAAGPPIGMSFHAVIYGEAENTSVVGKKKKKRKKKNQTSPNRLTIAFSLPLAG